jgi:hypothetical protein
MSLLRHLVNTDVILSQRLNNQLLVNSTCREPEAVVARLGAMQAQEYAMARWAIGLRLIDATDAAVEAAFNDGRILRTHVLRPTWHFVAPSDIRWLLALTAPRVRQSMAFNDRKFEVDGPLLRRSHAVFKKALRGGNQLTRAELQSALSRTKITADGTRLAHVVAHAELDALICSGPRRDRQFTYMLMDERVPATKALTREAALAELSRRYFATRSPATVQDFSWWSGLTLKDARAGVTMLGPGFAKEIIAGREYVLLTNSNATASGKKISFTALLPDYDEYGIAYEDRRALCSLPGKNADTAITARDMAYNRMIIVDGRIAGSWKRTEQKGEFAIETSFFSPPTKAALRTLKKAAERYSAFIGKSVRLLA